MDGECFGGNNKYIVNYSESYVDIFKITSNADMTFYVLYYGYKYSSFIIIGRHKNGTWLKYVGTNNVEKQYYGNSRGYWDKTHYLDKRVNLILLLCLLIGWVKNK